MYEKPTVEAFWVVRFQIHLFFLKKHPFFLFSTSQFLFFSSPPPSFFRPPLHACVVEWLCDIPGIFIGSRPTRRRRRRRWRWREGHGACYKIQGMTTCHSHCHFGWLLFLQQTITRTDHLIRVSSLHPGRWRYVTSRWCRATDLSKEMCVGQEWGLTSRLEGVVWEFTLAKKRLVCLL